MQDAALCRPWTAAGHAAQAKRAQSHRSIDEAMMMEAMMEAMMKAMVEAVMDLMMRRAV